ncbi:hypothetical protein [Exiguobacterium sp. s142]|uniref:hypothetical protein n=1 Tax=Exiguobacterium sp. s142 TaxID=2751222 RepID=UPI001BE92FD9|nr:hypothetical protein [Exiguobacterium sp. s142]
MRIKLGFEKGKFTISRTTVPDEDTLKKDREYYVYEWFFVESGQVFYVGKGKGDRYKSKDRGIEFKRLAYLHKSDVRIVKDGLTEKEALEYEEELISKYYYNGEKLINRVTITPNMYETKQKLEYKKVPYIESLPIEKHYYNVPDMQFDPIDEEKLKATFFIDHSVYGNEPLYYSDAETRERDVVGFKVYIKELEQRVAEKIVERSGRVYKSKAKAVKSIIVQGTILADSFVMLKEQGYEVYHLLDVMKLLGIEP